MRGLGGEHTPIGADGTVDISPSARFCIKEAEIITALYKVRKRICISYVSFLMLKTSSFCQDRLGTNAGKALTKREIMRFLLQGIEQLKSAEDAAAVAGD